jgi:multidrug efflux pump subunit AcrA (membrane-fusion protein)
MKQHIISLPHHPKRVIIISLIIAGAIGVFGYLKINQKVITPDGKNQSNLNVNEKDNSSVSRNLTLGFLTGGRIKSALVKAGDRILKGQILATLDAENTLGVLAQAKASYKTSEANYKKIINGATSAAIDVAKAVAHTAEVNLDGTTKQQELFVKNAYQNLLNSTPEALPSGGNSDYLAPAISGNYDLGKEGDIVISIYYTGNGASFNVSGITTGSGLVTTTTPQPIGDSGLYIKFPSVNSINVTEWIITIPNKKAENYLTNSNAYQTALENQSQAVKNAQAILDQANVSLSALLASARPEDIAVGQAQMDNAAGAVQIAEAALQNTIITAPSDGMVMSVAITPGQIAIPNAPAIEFISN